MTLLRSSTFSPDLLVELQPTAGLRAKMSRLAQASLAGSSSETAAKRPQVATRHHRHCLRRHYLVLTVFVASVAAITFAAVVSGACWISCGIARFCTLAGSTPPTTPSAPLYNGSMVSDVSDESI
ncbi:hypothetical protein PPTG_05578 [Phytophthora nicotianae INRA-310]|uniref:Transmembrane protein n=1 Tax=Phytophthora nicotianae (strain INRA-310) TaxID=761204 RepID=W2QZN7_PHYN3|nr:hypothetical protein PPTG_05578 [Phytophthora nicotianae INRA-310]ETN17909.1 hypothetical protein PPTG_05578 [Phytophthora nicotianae INRA-310]